MIAAKRDAGGAADAFDQPGERNDDRHDAQRLTRAPGAVHDGQHGGGLEKHAGDDTPVQHAVAHHPADDGDGDHGQRPDDDQPVARLPEDGKQDGLQGVRPAAQVGRVS